MGKRKPKPVTFGKLFRDPDDVGQSEYRAIFDTVVDAVFDGGVPANSYEPTLDELQEMVNIVDEFRLIATEHLEPIRQELVKKAISEAKANGLERAAGTT